MTSSDSRLAPTWATVLLAVIGVAVLAVAVMYFTETAAHLPSFFPGHEAGSTHHHTKHGIAAAAVGVAALIAAWVSTGKKKSPPA